MEYSIKTEPDFDIKWIKSEAELENMDCDIKIEIEVDDVGNNNSPFFKQEADQTDDISSDLESQGRIGSGSKKVEFFYKNREFPEFPAVYVDTEDQVRAVQAFVAEKKAEFNRRYNNGETPQYKTEAAIAKSILEESIVKHIKTCFTKGGMKAFKVGPMVKKRNYPKRSTIIKINQGGKHAEDGTKINMDLNADEFSIKDEAKVGVGFGASPFKTKASLMKPLKLSKELLEFLDMIIAPDIRLKALTKIQIKNHLWKYIKHNNLQDPNNRARFTPDTRMEPIFGKEKILYSKMIDFLKGHMD